jgi:uncharacterized membrane protein SpoIIM required for sporulation
VISTKWLEKRKAHWDRLEKLLDQSSSKGLRSLTRQELQDLGLLYRQIAADLAVIREDSSSVHFARYLNQLLARAHNIIYSGRKTNPRAALTFFWDTYPGIFRAHLNYCLTALIVFLGAGVFGTLLTLQDPDFQLRILGPRMVETIERREMWTHSILAIKPLASSAIMTNNMSVAFTTFAAGITFGVGTLFLLGFNGMMMGVIAAACWIAGMSLKLWSFVAPHGVLELPAIFIAGGAGLRLAQGLLFPGVLPRRDSLARAGAGAVKLVVGTIPMLVIAGVVEAFVSPTNLPVSLKFAMAAALFAMLGAYLWWPAKRAAKSEVRPG